MVWVTRLRLWAMASASCAIRSCRWGASDSRTRISYSVRDNPWAVRSSLSRRSISRVLPSTRARQERCSDASSHLVSPRLVSVGRRRPRSCRGPVVQPIRRRRSLRLCLPGSAPTDAAQPIRSRISAMPWPPPTHIVIRPVVLSCQSKELSMRVLQAGAGHAERVADGDRAAVDVEPVEVDAEVLVGRHDLGGERLVDLDQVDVADGHARRAPGLACVASTGPRPMISGERPRDAGGHDAGERREAELGRLGVGHDHHRGGAVVERAAVAGGDHAVGAEDRLRAGRPPRR